MNHGDFSFSREHLSLMERDARHVMGWRFHPEIMLSSGRGVKVRDVDGNDYFDMSAGMMSMVLGHSHPELAEVIERMATTFVHQSSWYANPWTVEFAEKIAGTLPGDLTVTQFAVTGSEANEAAMRMALASTGKFDIATAMRGLHGGSLAAESMTSVGGARKRGLGPLMSPAVSNIIIPPFYYRAPNGIDEAEWDDISLSLTRQLIEHSTSQCIAAIVVETIMVAGGMIVPSKRWLQGLREIADEWDALLVLDEAQLAPGRTGTFWGFEAYDVMPDVVTFAKGMSAGFSICGAVTSPTIADSVKGKMGLPWAGTYSHDPLACAVALKQLEIVLRDGLVERCAALGERIGDRLERLRERYDCIGDVRGRGSYWMLDIVRDKESKEPDFEMAERIRYNAAANGALFICVKNFLRIVPPSIISDLEIDDALGRLEEAVKRAESGYPSAVNLAKSSSLAANDIRHAKAS